MAGPVLTVDIIIEFPDREIVLVKRRYDPFKGCWAIPGGHVELGETVERAAAREALEETGLEVRLERLLGVYSEPGRDPRGHYVTLVYHAVPAGGKLKASSDAAEVLKTGSIDELKLAFDHRQILTDFLSNR
jgi:8-oxo-dGTP diphosphatase